MVISAAFSIVSLLKNPFNIIVQVWLSGGALFAPQTKPDPKPPFVCARQQTARSAQGH